MSTPRACASCSTPIPEGSLYCPSCGEATPTEISQETGRARPPVALSTDEAEQRQRLQRALGDGFELGRLLGRGGFAEVYAATDLKLRRIVAVKALRPDLVVNRSLTERFLREARAAAKLRQPNIIPIYQVGEAEGLAYFLMPLIEGESLREYMERVGPLPIEEAQRILREVAEALAVAHDAGLVHRDIKPDNIMLEGKERRAIVTDFGIAKALAAGETGLTGTGMIVGTPHYMSPEQATGEKTIDARSDIYSLGVVAYQMLTGRLPFEGETTQEVLVKQVTTRAAPVRDLRNDVPEDIAKAVDRMLARKPSERWHSCSEFARALTRRSQVGPEAAATSSRLARRWNRRAVRRVTALLALGGAVLIFGPGIARRLTGGRAPSSTESRLQVDAQRASDAPRPQWLANVGDSLLAVFVLDRRGGRSGLWFFDGTSWFQTAQHEERYTLPVRVGSTLVFLGHSTGRGGARRYAWAGRDLRLLDTVSVAARSMWSDGRTEILGDAAGGVFQRSGSGWIREPTGTTRGIWRIVGRNASHLVAILGGGIGWRDSIPDSLLVYDGATWRGLDPRTDRSALVSFTDATTLPDGSTIVVGDRRDQKALLRGLHRLAEMPADHPAVLQQDSSGGRWSELNLELPDSVAGLVGVWGRSAQDFYVWSHSGTCFHRRSSCVYHITRGRAELVVELSRVTLLDLVLFRGDPYGLADDGRVWVLRSGHWSPVLELPRSAIAYLAAAPALGAVAAADSGGLLNMADGGGSDDLIKESAWIRHTRFPGRTRGLNARDSTVVLLSDNALIRWSCVQGRTRRAPRDLVCDQDTLPVPGTSRLRAVAIMDRQNVLAGGMAGILVQWTGRRPVVLSVPAEARSDTFTTIVRAPGGKMLVLGSRTVLVVQGGRALLAGMRTATDQLQVTSAAALDDSTLVVAGRRQAKANDEVRIMRIGRPDEMRWIGDFATRARVHALGDGRLVVGVATPDDPAAGGSLRVRASLRLDQGWVEVPIGFDVYGVADDGEYLYATGSGWQFARIRLDSLPAPPRHD